MKIVLFGDDWGVPRLLAHVPREYVAGVVAAANRPHYHDALRGICAAMQVEFCIQPLPSSSDYAAFRRWIEDRAPDLVFVNSYSMIVREDILAIARLGGINIHGALLPEYRGCNPIQWAILNGETQTGVTLHEMSQRIDEGRIIDRQILPLHFEDTWRSVLDRIGDASGALIENNLAAILSGSWKAEPQQAGLARYHRRRTPDDGLFSWSEPVLHIYNLIRALVAPLPGAFYFDEQGRKMCISEYRTPAEVTQLKYGAAGGQVLVGERLRLLPLCLEDCDAAVSWIVGSETVVAQVLTGAGSDADRKNQLESRAPRRTDSVIFAIEDQATREFVGNCQLLDIDWRHRVATLSIGMAGAGRREPDLHAAAARLIADFGFGDLGLQKILVNVLPENPHQSESYRRCGFHPEREIPGVAPPAGNLRTLVIYEPSHA
jgi:methionyl-tRNA formyltransferase